MYRLSCVWISYLNTSSFCSSPLLGRSREAASVHAGCGDYHRKFQLVDGTQSVCSQEVRGDSAKVCAVGYWVNMSEDVNSYCHHCTCQATKLPTPTLAPLANGRWLLQPSWRCPCHTVRITTFWSSTTNSLNGHMPFLFSISQLPPSLQNW